jgi:hypothetical protein
MALVVRDGYFRLSDPTYQPPATNGAGTSDTSPGVAPTIRDLVAAGVLHAGDILSTAESPVLDIMQLIGETRSGCVRCENSTLHDTTSSAGVLTLEDDRAVVHLSCVWRAFGLSPCLRRSGRANPGRAGRIRGGPVGRVIDITSPASGLEGREHSASSRYRPPANPCPAVHRPAPARCAGPRPRSQRSRTRRSAEVRRAGPWTSAADGPAVEHSGWRPRPH